MGAGANQSKLSASIATSAEVVELRGKVDSLAETVKELTALLKKQTKCKNSSYSKHKKHKKNKKSMVQQEDDSEDDLEEEDSDDDMEEEDSDAQDEEDSEDDEEDHSDSDDNVDFDGENDNDDDSDEEDEDEDKCSKLCNNDPLSTNNATDTPQSLNGSNNRRSRKCELLNWEAPSEVVAIGRWLLYVFMANEISEKLAVVGFSANMVTYLTQQLHMPLTKAATTLTNFGGTASLTPLLGAFLADSYVGRFWAITAGSIIYQIGMITLTISAVLPQFRPPKCSGESDCKEASWWQLGILYISLLMTAIGAGGIRPCVVAFGADQFDESNPKTKTKTWNFFNWYYFCMGVSILLAVTVVVYIQDNVGWGWGLGIPTMAMAISVISFVGGYPMYRRLEPTGSPFTRLVQVMVAAFRKRKLVMVTDARLYENDELDAPISLGGKLLHTKQLSFLDKAAIMTDQDEEDEEVTKGAPPNLWRLATVHRVEELKSIIRMGPIWTSGILVITAAAQQNTFSLQQARSMDRHLNPSSSSFQIPPGSMTVFTMLAMLFTISLYDRLLIPFARRFTGLNRGISFLHRMAIGYFISILASFVAGFVEQKRKHVAASYNLINSPTAIIPISVFWLVPQYALHGIAEAFTSIAHLEFFYDQSPESMRSTSTALFWLVISAGSYMSTLLVSMIHKYSEGPGGSNWLPDNLNKGRLEYFYWIMTGLQVVNLVYFVICAKSYTFKPLEIRPLRGDDEEGDEEVEMTKV